MTEAPERIRNLEADVEYVRKDLYDAAIAHRRRSDAACYDWAEVSQASYQRAKRAEASIDEFLRELNHAYDNGNHINTTGIGDAIAIANRHLKPNLPTPPTEEP